MEDIIAWSSAPIHYTWCGLTLEQALQFNLDENPDKPGQYEWEALSDKQARSIIYASLDAFDVDVELIGMVQELSERVTEKFQGLAKRALTHVTEELWEKFFPGIADV